MTREEALVALRSERTIERLRAARFLLRTCTTADRDALLAARAAERDALVRSILERALGKLNGGVPVAVDLVAVSADPDLDDIYAQATEDISELYLHELRPIAGGLEHVFSSLEDSDGRVLTQRLKSLIAAIDKLREASAVPAFEEVNLSDLVRKVAREEGMNGSVAFGREDPVVVEADADLLKLALANIMRNAAEACVAKKEHDPITVSWGTTDQDWWVAVLDDGVGLPASAGKVWEPGSSTKSKDSHTGWGLTITRRAVNSLGAAVTLRPRAEGGTACEIRRPHEDEV